MKRPLATLLALSVLSVSPWLASSADETKRGPAQPSKLATTGPVPKPITPPSPGELQASIERGIDFLLADQRPDGSWGSAERTKGLNIFAPVPGAHHAFRLAVTALAVSALVECEATLDAERAAKVDKALAKAQVWMLANGKTVRRAAADALYNTWGHAFGLQGFVRLYKRAEGDKELNEDLQTKLLAGAQQQADLLDRYTYLNGGWGYYEFDGVTKVPGSSPNSFTTASGLIALHEARAIGVTYPVKKIKKGVASILRQRSPDYSYAYGEYLMRRPRYDINRPAGSLGRSQSCNLALRLWQEEVTGGPTDGGKPLVTNAVFKAWLNRLYARNGWLSIGRKYPVPHEAPFGVAGYFYYYGHYYAALTMEHLPAADRPYFQDHLAHILLPLQEKDGSWWDYPFYNYHQQYGTAMAVLSIRRCQHDAVVEEAPAKPVEQVAERGAAVR